MKNWNDLRNFETVNLLIASAVNYKNVQDIYSNTEQQISGEFIFLYLEEEKVINFTLEYKNKIFQKLSAGVKKEHLVKQCRTYALAEWAFGMHEMESKLNDKGEII